MIYFLEDEKLAVELRENRTPEFEKFIYFMLMAIWGLISSSSTYIAWTFHAPTPVEHILDFYILIISITALWTCYERNKEGDHRDFITRMTCISFPAYVRMSFLGLLIYVPGGLLHQYFGVPITDQILTVVTNLIIWPYMYYRIYTCIGIAAFPAPR